MPPPPPLPPPTAPILVHALSGLGKSHLARRYPTVTHDTDRDLDAALVDAFPELEGRARRIAWRALARRQPWTAPESADFARWWRARRALVGGVLGVLRGEAPIMVLTNLLILPWPVARYHGVRLGEYAAHWGRIDRAADNGQDEPSNARLAGYAPLVRLAPGAFLGQQPEVIAWLEAARERVRSTAPPAPTQPAPTQPAPTQPAPTERAPTMAHRGGPHR